MNILDALSKNKIIISHAEGRRLIAQGAVRRVVDLGLGMTITTTIDNTNVDVGVGETILVGATKQFTIESE